MKNFDELIFEGDMVEARIAGCVKAYCDWRTHIGKESVKRLQLCLFNNPTE